MNLGVSLNDLADGASLAGAVVAAAAIIGGSRTAYRSTLGRRRDRYSRLARLGPGAQLSFFAAVLGEPPAIRQTLAAKAWTVVVEGDPDFDLERADPDDRAYQEVRDVVYTECFFIDRDYYVQTISDDDDTVLAFTVTSRSRRFAPKFEAPTGMNWLRRRKWRRAIGEPYKPLFRVRLGRTRFAELDSSDPETFSPPRFQFVTAARKYSYSEIAYFGNPGHYLTYVFSASDVAPADADWPVLWRLQEQVGYPEWPYPRRVNPNGWQPPDLPPVEPDWDQIPAAQQFRRTAAITAITVIHHRLWVDNFPSTFGPHGDEVRLLP